MRTCVTDPHPSTIESAEAGWFSDVTLYLGPLIISVRFQVGPESSRQYHSTGLSRVLQVLLVSSSRYPDQWIVPGGGVEPEEEPGGAAAREVYEEVRGDCLGVLQDGLLVLCQVIGS